MNSSIQHAGILAALRRCNWICVVLATLLLYNPFSTALRSGHSLDVRHPVSHRASVGASELEHFAPADGWGALAAMDATEAQVALPLPALPDYFFFVSPPTLLHTRQFFGSGLWFRPPPVR